MVTHTQKTKQVNLSRCMPLPELTRNNLIFRILIMLYVKKRDEESGIFVYRKEKRGKYEETAHPRFLLNCYFAL